LASSRIAQANAFPAELPVWWNAAMTWWSMSGQSAFVLHPVPSVPQDADFARQTTRTSIRSGQTRLPTSLSDWPKSSPGQRVQAHHRSRLRLSYYGAMIATAPWTAPWPSLIAPNINVADLKTSLSAMGLPTIPTCWLDHPIFAAWLQFFGGPDAPPPMPFIVASLSQAMFRSSTMRCSSSQTRCDTPECKDPVPESNQQS
jgi:hypothetical protein